MNAKTNKSYRIISLVFLLAAFVYGWVLPFCWGNDPSETLGTLSILCENHIPYFWLWSVLTGGAFALNLILLYKTYGEKNPVLYLAVGFALLGMVLTAATLNHSIADWNPKRVFHWIGAICYAAGLTAAFLLFYLKNLKKNKYILWLLLVTFVCAVGVLVRLLVFGRNGYMEIIPLAVLELELFVLNFTPLGRPGASEA
ncbi:MAG: hypothetical protein IK104_10395 [Clostridia bacterium]|nr:hypothetical protein [Clostridia bacterium]